MAQTQEDAEDDDKIKSTKTVQIAEDVHNAIGHISMDEESPIKTVVDEILRDDDNIQRELEYRQNSR
jgi:hypothetical protein